MMTIIHILVLALLVHLTPNVLMKVVKSTHTGHKILTATFELGLQGKELNKMTLDLLSYVIGPESLVEYQLGKKFNKELGLTKTNYNVIINSFRKQLESNFNSMTENELKEAKKTPFVNTLIIFVTEDNSKLVTLIEKVIIKKDSKRTVVNLLVYVALAVLAVIVDPVALLQPVICLVRKKIGTSSFGKKVLKDNLLKGLEAKTFSKPFELFMDLFVAPSVLDTQRLGLYLSKNFL